MMPKKSAETIGFLNPVKRHYAFLFILAVLSLYFACAERQIFSDDTAGYLMRSDQIYDFSFRSIRVLTGRPPFYPLLIGPSMIIFGRNLIALHIFPLLFFLSIPFSLYYLGRRILKQDPAAFLCVLLFLLFPTNIRHLATPLTEPLCVALILLSLLLLDKCLENLRYLPLYGLVLAFLFLTRYETMLLIIPQGLYLLWALKKDGRLTRRKLIFVVSVLLLFQLPFALINFAGGSMFLPARSFHAVKLALHSILHPGHGMYPGYPPIKLIGISYKNYLGGNPLIPILILGGAIMALYRRAWLLIIGAFWCAGLYVFVVYYGTNTWFIRHLSKATPFVCLLIIYLCLEIWNLCRRTSNKTLKILLLSIGLGFPAAALLFSAYRDQREGRDETRYTLNRASLVRLWRNNAGIPSLSAWHRLKSQKLKPREEIIREVLGHSRSPKYLKQRADAVGIVNFYADFSDWGFRSFLAGTPEIGRFWKGPGAKCIGVFPKYGETEVTFHFSFPQDIKILEYCDRHVSWTRKDRVSLSFSWDGRHWDEWYQDSRCYRPISFGRKVKADRTARRAFYLRYRFRAGDPRREPFDNGGAALKEMALAFHLGDAPWHEKEGK